MGLCNFLLDHVADGTCLFLFPLRRAAAVSVLRLRQGCDFHLRSFVFVSRVCTPHAQCRFLFGNSHCGGINLPFFGSQVGIDHRPQEPVFLFCGVSTGSKAGTTGIGMPEGGDLDVEAEEKPSKKSKNGGAEESFAIRKAYIQMGCVSPDAQPKNCSSENSKIGSESRRQNLQQAHGTKKIGKERVHPEASLRSGNLMSVILVFFCILALPSLRRGHKR